MPTANTAMTNADVEVEPTLDGEVVDDVGADHVDLAVSKLNDVHDAQDEGEPKGHQYVDTGRGQPVQDPLQNARVTQATPPSLDPLPAPMEPRSS